MSSITTGMNPTATGAVPSVLAIGDSWFWYPANNLLLEWIDRMRPEFGDIYSIGYVGAKLEQYMPYGKYGAQIARSLTHDSLQYLSTVLISGAGNDAVDWSFALFKDCRELDTCQACVDPAALTALMTSLFTTYTSIIGWIRSSAAAASLAMPDIILHTYDYAPVNGVGFGMLRSYPVLKPWITQAMDSCGVNPDRQFREGVVTLFIDRLCATLMRLHRPQGGVYVVNSVGTLDRTKNWANELHPDPEGFAMLMEGPWTKTLQGTRYVR